MPLGGIVEKKDEGATAAATALTRAAGAAAVCDVEEGEDEDVRGSEETLKLKKGESELLFGQDHVFHALIFLFFFVSFLFSFLNNDQRCFKDTV